MSALATVTKKRRGSPEEEAGASGVVFSRHILELIEVESVLMSAMGQIKNGVLRPKMSSVRQSLQGNMRWFEEQP